MVLLGLSITEFSLSATRVGKCSSWPISIVIFIAREINSRMGIRGFTTELAGETFSPHQWKKDYARAEKGPHLGLSEAKPKDGIV